MKKLFFETEKDGFYGTYYENPTGSDCAVIGLFGDDSFWEAAKYIRRMDRRLKERPHTCSYETLVYEHGTHFVLPESLLRMALPIGLKFVLRFIFRAAKEYPDECEAARKDIDRRLSAALKEWREENTV